MNKYPEHFLYCFSFLVLCLTTALIISVGLTCGMYTKDAVELPSLDSAAGLYVKTRSGQIIKVIYPSAHN